MANMLSQFLIGGGNLTPNDTTELVPNDAIGSSLNRWMGRGRQIPFGMSPDQFRLFAPRYEEFRRRMTGRPGQERAVLAEMGFTGAGNNQPPPTQTPPPSPPPVTPPAPPTTRNVTTIPYGADGTAGQPPPETGGGTGAAGALGGFADLFSTPPPTTTPPPVADIPPTTPPPNPPRTTTADTGGIGDWTTTVTSAPNPMWADIGRGLRNYGQSEGGPDGRVNPISQGLLAGLGAPLPPPQLGWLSNPLDSQRRSPRMTRYTGMFG